MGPEFIQLSGEDMTALPFQCRWRAGLHLGGVECGAAPVRRMQAATLAGDYAAANLIQDRLIPRMMRSSGAGLAGAKYGLSVLGQARNEVRLPLMPVTEPTHGIIRAAMVHAGLLNA